MTRRSQPPRVPLDMSTGLGLSLRSSAKLLACRSFRAADNALSLSKFMGLAAVLTHDDLVAVRPGTDEKDWARALPLATAAGSTAIITAGTSPTHKPTPPDVPTRSSETLTNLPGTASHSSVNGTPHLTAGRTEPRRPLPSTTAAPAAPRRAGDATRWLGDPRMRLQRRTRKVQACAGDRVQSNAAPSPLLSVFRHRQPLAAARAGLAVSATVTTTASPSRTDDADVPPGEFRLDDTSRCVTDARGGCKHSGTASAGLVPVHRSPWRAAPPAAPTYSAVSPRLPLSVSTTGVPERATPREAALLDPLRAGDRSQAGVPPGEASARSLADTRWRPSDMASITGSPYPSTPPVRGDVAHSTAREPGDGEAGPVDVLADAAREALPVST